MTTDAVVFDTWAWWAIVFDEPGGRRLRDRHVRPGGVHTSAWALAELSAKLGPRVPTDLWRDILATIRLSGPIEPVTEALALEAARLRSELRRKSPRASLGDGVMLATARSLGLPLISGDAAFRGQKDVRAS
jgi:predicted nucleic acid-binding protein